MPVESLQQDKRDAAARLAQATAKLSTDQLHEVADFAAFLAEGRKPAASREKPSVSASEGPRRFDTSKLYGALSHLKGQYASGVELQHAIMREDWGQVD